MEKILKKGCNCVMCQYGESPCIAYLTKEDQIIVYTYSKPMFPEIPISYYRMGDLSRPRNLKKIKKEKLSKTRFSELDLDTSNENFYICDDCNRQHLIFEGVVYCSGIGLRKISSLGFE